MAELPYADGSYGPPAVVRSTNAVSLTPEPSTWS